MAERNHTINYIELPVNDMEGTKAFYSSVFEWQFKEWGPGYMSFSGAGVKGGFNNQRQPSEHGVGPLVVLYADDLDARFAAVTAAGREISEDIFEFPGGRRFHFVDPNGNEIAIWSEPPLE